MPRNCVHIWPRKVRKVQKRINSAHDIILFVQAGRRTDARARAGRSNLVRTVRLGGHVENNTYAHSCNGLIRPLRGFHFGCMAMVAKVPWILTADVAGVTAGEVRPSLH